MHRNAWQRIRTIPSSFTTASVGGTSRITEHATVRIEIQLPPDVILADEPTRRSVILNRGTPTTMNTPALDHLLMYDTREPDLQRQAFNAIRGHAQNTREPTTLELDLIQDFQQQDSRFFSSEVLRAFATGGPPPQLPAGTTESERRGRAMFDDVPFDPQTATTAKGICSMCHSGPMLNQFARINPVGPPGGRRADIGVSQRNLLGNPVYSPSATEALAGCTPRPFRRAPETGNYTPANTRHMGPRGSPTVQCVDVTKGLRHYGRGGPLHRRGWRHTLRDDRATCGGGGRMYNYRRQRR